MLVCPALPSPRAGSADPPSPLRELSCMHVMTEELTASTLPRWDQLEVFFFFTSSILRRRSSPSKPCRQQTKCLLAVCTEGRKDVWLARCLELGVALRRLPAACAKTMTREGWRARASSSRFAATDSQQTVTTLERTATDGQQQIYGDISSSESTCCHLGFRRQRYGIRSSE